MQATSVYSDAQEEVTGDEQTASYEYSQNVALGFWTGIAKVTATDSAGEILSQSETDFDGDDS